MQLNPQYDLVSSSLLDEDASIYTQILNDISKGIFVSGDRLVTTKLAARYSTSINPVREALKQLQGEGFVTIHPNSGARVTVFEYHTMRDVFEILQLLELYLITWFVEEHTEAQRLELSSILQQMRELNPTDYVQYRELDTQFHWGMYRHHYNKSASDLWRKKRLVLLAFLTNLTFNSNRFDQSMEEHEAILNGLEKRDVAAVKQVLDQHIANSGQYWSRQFQR